MTDQPQPVRGVHQRGHGSCTLCAIVDALPTDESQKDALRRRLVQEWVSHAHVVSEICAYAPAELQPIVDRFADELALRIRQPMSMISLVRDALRVTDARALELVQRALKQASEAGCADELSVEPQQSIVMPRPVWLFVTESGARDMDADTAGVQPSGLRDDAKRLVEILGGLCSNTATPDDIQGRLKEMIVDVVYIAGSGAEHAIAAAEQARQVVPWVGVVIEEWGPRKRSCVQGRGPRIPALDRRAFRALSAEVHVRLPNFISGGPMPHLQVCDLVIGDANGMSDRPDESAGGSEAGQ